MRNKLLLIAIASTFIGNSLMADGWGQKQTQRTVGGGLTGATIGGIIGHQHGKQKEGIIIGSVLGMIIGNKSGKGADHRAEQQRWEQQKEKWHIVKNCVDENKSVKVNIVINKCVTRILIMVEIIVQMK